MPYWVRESWLSMNTLPFRTVSEWTILTDYALMNFEISKYAYA